MSIELEKLETISGEIRPVPFADHVKATYCSAPGCPHVHLLLCTKDGRPYTMAVLSYEQLDRITELAAKLKRDKLAGRL